jgi:hypothetical protein
MSKRKSMRRGREFVSNDGARVTGDNATDSGTSERASGCFGKQNSVFTVTGGFDFLLRLVF